MDSEILLHKEISKLEDKYEFKYHMATGIILFLYILYQLDIEFLAVLLSKHSNKSNKIYYKIVVQVILIISIK